MRKIIASLLLGTLLVSSLAVNASAERIVSTAEKIEKAPVIDGVITAEEWGTPIFSGDPLYNEHFVGAMDEAPITMFPNNIDIYTRWDDKALYIGIVVDEKIYFNSTGGWDGDSIEIDLVADGKEQAVRFRTNAARNSTDGTGTKSYFHRPTADLTGREDWVVPFGPDNGTACEIGANGNVLSYEWAFDWANIHPGSDIKEGHEILINYQFHMTDDGSDIQYVSYASLDETDAKEYVKIVLGGLPVVETEAETVAEVVDTAAAVVAPQTFDAGIIAAVAAVVSLAGYAVSKKQK